VCIGDASNPRGNSMMLYHFVRSHTIAQSSTKPDDLIESSRKRVDVAFVFDRTQSPKKPDDLLESSRKLDDVASFCSISVNHRKNLMILWNPRGNSMMSYHCVWSHTIIDKTWLSCRILEETWWSRTILLYRTQSSTKLDDLIESSRKLDDVVSFCLIAHKHWKNLMFL